MSDNPSAPRLLVITGVFPPLFGGTVEIMRQVADRWPRSRVTVWTPKFEGWEAFDASTKAKVVRSDLFTITTSRYDWLPPEQLARIRSTRWIHRAFARWKACRFIVKALIVCQTLLFAFTRRWDVLVAGYLFDIPGVSAWVLKIITGRPIVGLAVGEEMTACAHELGWRRRLRRLWLRNYDLLIVISEATRGTALHWGVPAARSWLWRPGVDVERFHPSVDCGSIQSRYSLQGHRVVLTVGRLVERKGVDTVLRALPQVLLTMPNVKYVVVGAGSYEPQLRRLVAQCALERYVIFVGEVPELELPLYYAACDVFALISRPIRATGDDEGFGMALVEASACGKPVIGGRTGGIVDAVQDGVTGLLVDPFIPADTAEAILQLLTVPGLGDALGRAGRRRAEEMFDWNLRIAELTTEFEARFGIRTEPA